MHQLDIFADSQPVQRANDLIGALANLDRPASRQALRRLEDADPRHANLPQYRMLCDFVEYWTESCNDPDWLNTPAAIAAEEQLIREQIIPAAIVAGNAGGDLVRKCWFILAQASEGAGITPEHCNYFAAELYLRAQHFSDVVRTAQRIPGADMRAAVQRWLCLGFYGCEKIEQAQSAALRYAWLAPQRFDAFVDETGDAKLARDWSDFQADLGDNDATWFPAWCSHEKKATIPMMENLPSSDGGVAYRLIMDLVVLERGGLGPAVYKTRARLKQLNESFFAFYMKHRSDLHARKK